MKEDIGSYDVSPRKLELGDDLRVEFLASVTLVFRLPFYLGK